MNSKAGDMRLTEKAADILGHIVHRWRWWHAFVAVVAITLLSWGGFWWVQSSALERRYAEMRAAGYPITMEELNDYYALPSGVKDNTDLWLKAIRLGAASSSSGYRSKLPIVGQGPAIPPVGQHWAEKDLVAAYLEAQAETLTAIHSAADAGGAVRYPHDFREGWESYSAFSDKIQVLCQFARLLSLEAHLRAHDDDTAGVVDSLRATFAVGRTLERDPILLASLVRLTLDGMAIEEISKLLHIVEPTSDDLRAIQADLRIIDYADDLQHAIIGERATTIAMYDDLPMWGSISSGGPFARLVTLGAKAKYLDLTQDAVVAGDKPWHEALSLASTVVANWKPNKMNPIDNLVDLLVPHLEMCFRASARATAQAVSLDVAIAAELFRREHGELPRALSELVPQYLPAVPLDPFDGKPLRYIVEDGCFVVYSVGQNFVEDGGDVDYHPTKGYLDFGFRWGPKKPVTESSKVE